MNNCSALFNRLARRALQITWETKHELLPGQLSALQVMVPLWNRFDPCRDVLILSKGHAAPAYYAFLESFGFKPDVTTMFPRRDPKNGIPCSTGSLGHGLPMAVGIALAQKLAGLPGTVFVLMGDGECLEGTTWESLCIAKTYHLTNLEVHIDGNGCGCLGYLPINCAPWLPIVFPEYVAYHSTIKGMGISFLQGTKDHKRTLTEEEYHQAIQDLGGRLDA